MSSGRQSIAEQVQTLIESLNSRDRVILQSRFLSDDKVTLDAVGMRLNLTRERVRQLERDLMSRLQNWQITNDVVGQFCNEVVDSIGLVASRFFVTSEFPELSEEIEIQQSIAVGELPIWRVLQGLFGYFECDGSWFYANSRNHVVSLFNSRFDELTGGEKYLHPNRVLEVLDGWGSADPEELLRWIESLGYRFVHGALVPPETKSMNDLAFVALSVSGLPMTTQDLHRVVAATKSIRSLANQMSTDPRLQRIAVDTWGLVQWGGEAFTSIRDALLARVGEGEFIPLSDLVQDIASRFGVAESSIRTYASGWPFKCERGIVSRQEETVTPQGRPFPRSRGAFVIPGGYAFRGVVTVDHLRGSGSQFPTALAVTMGSSIDSSLTFASTAGLGAIRLGWNGNQPTMSTLKAELDLLDAKVGDAFAVLFRDSSAEVLLLPPAIGDPFADLGRLCLISKPNEVTRVSVAKSLGLDESAVWDEILQSAEARKDTELVTALESVIELILSRA